MSHCDIKIPPNLIKDLKKLNIQGDAAVEVYYLEAVLGGLPGKKIPKNDNDNTRVNLMTPNGYHTGVGFRVITRDGLFREFVFDLTANDFGKYVLVPKIDYTTGKFEWCNGAFYNFDPIINREYWVKSSIICTITPNDLIAIIDWLLNDYIPKHSTYIFLTLISQVSRQDIFNPVKRSCLCDDFCYDIFRYLQNDRGIAINYFTVPQYNIAAIVIGKNASVKEIPESDQRVLTFFKSLNDIIMLVPVLMNDKSMAEKIAEAKLYLQDIKNTLGKAGIEAAKNIVEEVFDDILGIGRDIMQILSLINIDSDNPKVQDVINAYKAFVSKPDIGTFMTLVQKINEFLSTIDNAIVKQDLADIKSKINDLYMIIPRFMAKLKTIIYYGYKDDRSMGYFLVQSDAGFGLYVNYLDTDLMRDREFLDIYGKKSRDIYSRQNDDKKVIHNYNCSKNQVYMLYIFLAILLILFIVMLLTRRK